jgi:hypothetical protein
VRMRASSREQQQCGARDQRLPHSRRMSRRTCVAHDTLSRCRSQDRHLPCAQWRDSGRGDHASSTRSIRPAAALRGGAGDQYDDERPVTHLCHADSPRSCAARAQSNAAPPERGLLEQQRNAGGDRRTSCRPESDGSVGERRVFDEANAGTGSHRGRLRRHRLNECQEWQREHSERRAHGQNSAPRVRVPPLGRSQHGHVRTCGSCVVGGR